MFIPRSHRLEEPADALGDEIRVSNVTEIVLDDNLGARHILSEPFTVLPGERGHHCRRR